ncbi:carbonic anhydrase [Agarivorans sp. Alg241-V36]|uniref:carbonic anhydrase n=1 Tax=Agarivorans sp. Alg241-V36 TaxID=2305992 RepID=UPI0013D70803|nr:carbonic anhydrase [Agarivorans sp. Alg241-V36]
MNKQQVKRVLISTVIAISGGALAQGDVHWGYSGHQGPEHWGELAPEFSLCTSGKNQSPINISATTKGQLPSLALNYQASGNEIINNGHTIQVNYAPGSYLDIAGHQFELKQFHFHSPSENTLRGKSFPLEAHFVHADSKGNLAVVALMFEQGNENQELAKAWSQLPQEAGQKARLATPINGLNMLPSKHDYYRFNGSLTTPPCSEGVRWIVLKNAVSASKQQINDFSSLMKLPNNRPVQGINARLIVE